MELEIIKNLFPGLDLQKHVIPSIEPRSYAINQRSGTSHQTVPKKGDAGMSMAGVSVATLSCFAGLVSGTQLA